MGMQYPELELEVWTELSRVIVSISGIELVIGRGGSMDIV